MYNVQNMNKVILNLKFMSNHKDKQSYAMLWKSHRSIKF